MKVGSEVQDMRCDIHNRVYLGRQQRRHLITCGPTKAYWMPNGRPHHWTSLPVPSFLATANSQEIGSIRYIDAQPANPKRKAVESSSIPRFLYHRREIGDETS